MKKILFINLFLILLLLPSFAGNISLFEEVKLPFFIYFNRTKYHPVAYFEYNDENNYSVGFDGAGYSIITTGIYQREDVLYVEFIKIWNGSEEISENDRRKIFKYCVPLLRQSIIDGNDINDIEPIFIAEDTINGVTEKQSTQFSVNCRTSVNENPFHDDKNLFFLNKGDLFELRDIISISNNVWLKISKDSITGYIPLSSLNANWKIEKNDLRKHMCSSVVSAVCNDFRVRVRFEKNLNCKTVTFINKNDCVKIIDRSEEKFQIEGEKWYWYEIELSDGKIGWVYGKYLDIEK